MPGGQWKVLQRCLLVRKVFWDGLVCGSWYTGHFFSRLVQELNGSFKPSSDSPHACFFEGFGPKMLWRPDKPLWQHLACQMPCLVSVGLGGLPGLVRH